METGIPVTKYTCSIFETGIPVDNLLSQKKKTGIPFFLPVKK